MFKKKKKAAKAEPKFEQKSSNHFKDNINESEENTEQAAKVEGQIGEKISTKTTPSPQLIYSEEIKLQLLQQMAESLKKLTANLEVLAMSLEVIRQEGLKVIEQEEGEITEYDKV